MNSVRRLFTQFKGWWTSRSTKVKGVIIAIVAIVLFILAKGGGDSATSNIIKVKADNLTRTVKASGTVVSSTDLTLAFQTSKMVRSVTVGIGDKVKKDQILAILSNSAERAAATSARGALLAAEARYQKVLDGSSNEQVKLAQVKLANATASNDTLVENARRALLSSNLKAKGTAALAADNEPIISGTYTGTEGEYRLDFDQVANRNSISFRGIESGSTRLIAGVPQALGTKGLFIVFPSTAALTENMTWVISIPNVEGANYIDNLNRYNDAVKTREAAIATATAELDLTRATARQPDIDAALADVVTAQAGVQQANAIVENTILRAPADGTITKVNVKVGEVPKANEEVMRLEDVGNLYLEANVNESSVSLLALGQSVDVTFDAFGPSKIYSATVSSIDPSATIKDGVVNYKIKALLNNTDGIRPGMTANMTVTTTALSHVVQVPGRALIRRDGHVYVSVITDMRRMRTEEREVTLGVTGDGDMIEVVGGLGEGETILATTK